MPVKETKLTKCPYCKELKEIPKIFTYCPDCMTKIWTDFKESKYKNPEPNTSKETMNFSGENTIDWKDCGVKDCMCDCHYVD